MTPKRPHAFSAMPQEPPQTKTERPQASHNLVSPKMRSDEAISTGRTSLKGSDAVSGPRDTERAEKLRSSLQCRQTFSNQHGNVLHKLCLLILNLRVDAGLIGELWNLLPGRSRASHA